jgi:hypothetical protein
VNVTNESERLNFSNLSSAGGVACFHLGDIECFCVDCFSLDLEVAHVCILWNVKSLSLCGFHYVAEFVHDYT